MKENLVDKLNEAGLIYLVIGYLISADSLVDAKSCHESLDFLEVLQRDFKTSSLKDDLKLKTFLDRAERIIQRDLHYSKNTTDENNRQQEGLL